jgi:hypothetical protein
MFPVGTPFTASGDSSPCTSMKLGNKGDEGVHGDKSPDAIMLFNNLIQIWYPEKKTVSGGRKWLKLLRFR